MSLPPNPLTVELRPTRAEARGAPAQSLITSSRYKGEAMHELDHARVYRTDDNDRCLHRLSRRFREQTGTTPAMWIVHSRVRRAQRLLETTGLSVEQIATEVGFRSSSVLREHFGQVVKTSPQAYRRSFSVAEPTRD